MSLGSVLQPHCGGSPLWTTEALLWWIQITQITSNFGSEHLELFLVTPISCCCLWRFYHPRKLMHLTFLHICLKLQITFIIFQVLCLFTLSTVFSRNLKFKKSLWSVSSQITADKFLCKKVQKVKEVFRNWTLESPIIGLHLISVHMDGRGKVWRKTDSLELIPENVSFKDCPVLWALEMWLLSCINLNPAPQTPKWNFLNVGP